MPLSPQAQRTERMRTEQTLGGTYHLHEFVQEVGDGTITADIFDQSVQAVAKNDGLSPSDIKQNTLEELVFGVGFNRAEPAVLEMMGMKLASAS
jgi:hypothetical protein